MHGFDLSGPQVPFEDFFATIQPEDLQGVKDALEKASVRALKSGAVEFLTKPFRDQDLLDAIQQALQRDRAERDRQAEIHDLQERYGAFNCTRAASYGSRRLRNARIKQIASEIGASEATVKIHRGNVMRKMKTGSVVDLVRMADKLKLSPSEAGCSRSAARVIPPSSL